MGEKMGENEVGRELGPGWRVALEVLGERGEGIARIWAERDCGEAGEEEWPEFGEELRLGTRWRRYGRCGEVCALLRQAGRRDNGGATHV